MSRKFQKLNTPMLLKGVTYTMFKYDTTVDKKEGEGLFSDENKETPGEGHCVIKFKENDTTNKKPLISYIGIGIIYHEKYFTFIFDKRDYDNIGCLFYRNKFACICCNNGLDLGQMLHHIGIRCKDLNKPEILQNVVGLSEKDTKIGIKYVREHMGPTTIVQEEEKDILTKKNFICSPILKNGHWTVAVISKDEINIFDPTLQTKVSGTDYCELEIGDMEKQTFNCLNKNCQIQKYPAESTICGLCSTEFIIWASQCDSLEHLKQNINTICDKVAANVIEAIGQKM